MATITSWLWGTSQVDDAVDKATSELLPIGSEDMALNLEICDQIRSKAVPPKDAMRALKRRLNHKNPNVQLLALGLTDICIKNGGDHFLTEVASRDFMDNLVSILKMPMLNTEVKNKILRLIQNWAVAFEGRIALSYVGHVYKNLQSEGFDFPPKDPAIISSAMVDTQTAPEWIDSDVCLRCRTPFTFTNRKHHCRNCGQVFDQQCSSKILPLPHFGITQEVRVCDGCYSKLIKNRDTSVDTKGHRHTSSRHRTAREFDDAELHRAIQLSLDEVGAAGGRRPGYVPSQPSSAPWQPSSAPWQPSSPPLVDRSSRPSASSSKTTYDEEDPDLKAAIEASLREAQAPKPSAPIVVSESPRTSEYEYTNGYSQPYQSTSTSRPSYEPLPNYDLEPLESDAILTFSQTMNQVQTQGGGRDISRYPAVNGLYDKASSLRPKVARSLDDTTKRQELLTEMHDKLSEAVKLYDHLLTRQVSHPPWRSSQPLGVGPYQPVTSPAHVGSPAPAESYSEWRPSYEPRPLSSNYQVAGDSTVYQRQQPQTPAPYAKGVHQGYEYSEQAYQRSPRLDQPQSPAPMSPRQAVSPDHVQGSTMTANSQPQWPRYAAATQYSTPGPIHSAVVSPYRQSAQPVQEASAPSFDLTPRATPMVLPQSPPPPTPQIQYNNRTPAPIISQPPPAPSLSRHNTYTTYSTVSSPPPATNHSLSRHNTLSYLPSSSQQHISLPNFPMVPTAPPQSIPMYGEGVEQTERKEALLIDL